MYKSNQFLKYLLDIQLFAEEDEGNNGNNDNNGSNEDKQDQPTSFSQEDLDKAVKDGIETAKKKWEEEQNNKQSEAEKLKKMTAKEKEEYQQQKREDDLLKREKALAERELRATAKDTLAEKGLPTALAECLDYSSAENCNKSIDEVGKAFEKAVQDAIADRIKGGKTMKKAVGNTTLTMDDVKKMSPQEINENWEEIQQLMQGK